MTTLPVIVDDEDIEYSGFWNHSNGNQEYKGTVSSYPTPGFEDPSYITPSLSTSFDALDGSDIVFYGKLTAGLVVNYMIDGGPHLPMQFSGNGAVIGLAGTELWRLSVNSTRLDNHHSLMIFPITGLFVFDYYTYTPSADVMERIPRDTIMDDQDAMVKYSSGWTHNLNVKYPTGIPYLATSTGTNVTGSTMQVTFPGYSFSMYGAFQQVHGSLSISFSVDNAPPTFLTLAASQSNSSQWNISVPLFQTDVSLGLPRNGAHTLLVTLENVTGSQTLWIDYFILQDKVDLMSTADPLNPNPSSSGSVSPGHRISGRALAGIVVAVVVVLFVLVVGCIKRCLMLCRRKPATPQESPTSPAEPKSLTPEPPAPEELSETQNSPASIPNLPTALQGILSQHQANVATHWDTSAIPLAEATFSNPSFSSTSMHQSPSQGTAMVQHQTILPAHPLLESQSSLHITEPRTFVVGEGMPHFSSDGDGHDNSTSGLAHPAQNLTDEDGRTPVHAARERAVRPLPPVPGVASSPYGPQ